MANALELVKDNWVVAVVVALLIGWLVISLVRGGTRDDEVEEAELPEGAWPQEEEAPKAPKTDEELLAEWRAQSAQLGQTAADELELEQDREEPDASDVSPVPVFVDAPAAPPVWGAPVERPTVPTWNVPGGEGVTQATQEAAASPLVAASPEGDIAQVVEPDVATFALPAWSAPVPAALQDAREPVVEPEPVVADAVEPGPVVADEPAREPAPTVTPDVVAVATPERPLTRREIRERERAAAAAAAAAAPTMVGNMQPAAGHVLTNGGESQA